MAILIGKKEDSNLNIDFFIITNSIMEFVVFLGLHIIIFRRVNRQQVLKWLTSVFLFVGIITSICLWLTLSLLIKTDQQLLLKSIIILVIFFLYVLFVFTYIISLFGAVESAVRVQLLNLVDRAGDKGLKKTTILKKYNTKWIIEKRLQRMVSSGELLYINNKYKLNRRWSLIFIPAFITKMIWQIYDMKSSWFNPRKPF